MAQAPLGEIHYVDATIYKAQKALIAAKFNGIVITTKKFELPDEAQKPAFVDMNPMGKVPFLKTSTGCISSSNSIARYVARCRADTGLYGKCFDDESQIDSWVEFCAHELEVPLAAWLYPVLCLMAPPPAAISENAKKNVKQALQLLEDNLKESAFLVGDFVTLADIVVVCALKDSFMRIFDPPVRKPFPKLCAWFELCCNLPQFKAVLGDVTMCKEEEKPSAPTRTPTGQENMSKVEAKKATPKKEAAPKPKAKSETKLSPAPKDTLAPSAGNEALEKEIKVVADELRLLKDKLKAEGTTGKKLNEHPEVKVMVEKLTGLKAQL